MHYTRILGRPAAQLPASWARLLRVARATSAVALVTVFVPSMDACGEDLQARSGLAGAFPSPEAATQAALDALGAGDREAMEALLLTREEHRNLIWDQLPEREYFSFDYVRFLNEKNSGKALSQALGRYRGSELELLSLSFEKESETYSDFVLHRGAKLTVRRPSDGREGELQLVDVFVERNGGWKIMNYVE
ncbi:MAG: DUF2950 domain-containing protein [marine benthic group bacterium]|nr:DUF2950 domain-containing protein [Candidatus Benthicola marisminoris]